MLIKTLFKLGKSCSVKYKGSHTCSCSLTCISVNETLKENIFKHVATGLK